MNHLKNTDLTFSIPQKFSVYWYMDTPAPDNTIFHDHRQRLISPSYVPAHLSEPRGYFDTIFHPLSLCSSLPY